VDDDPHVTLIPVDPARAEVVVFWPEAADEPLIRRGACWCGQPIALVQHGATARWTFDHGELALFSADEYMLMANEQGPRQFDVLHRQVVGTRLLREALHQLHAWDRPAQRGGLTTPP
jgi:hypothetical protein